MAPLMDDVELARLAAQGDGGAFATLYDRHERRAYNLCYRITGSPDDAADATQETFLKVLERLPGLAGREVNFGSYLLTAARHASYDAIERRRRAAPAGEIPDSAVPVAAGAGPEAPEPLALRAAHQEDIRAANALLPARQREALVLREVEELSYDQVAEVMGMNRNSVAQLISRARLNLRDGLRRGALVSIPAASPDCESALPLLALAQDGELDDATHADWLARHLTGCATCRVRVEAMQEAGHAYRLWLPLVPGLWLRTKIAKAAGRRTAARTRLFRRRRLGAVAGAGMLLLVGTGLAAADAVHAPGRAFTLAPAPAPKRAFSAPAPDVALAYKPAPRVERRHRLAARPVRAVVAAVETPDAVPVAPAQPTRALTVRRHAAPKPPPERAERVPAADPPPADAVAEDPPPVVVEDPPPDPPDPPDPTCPAGGTAAPVPGCPQPPPKPPSCSHCAIVGPIKAPGKP